MAYAEGLEDGFFEVAPVSRRPSEKVLSRGDAAAGAQIREVCHGVRVLCHGFLKRARAAGGLSTPRGVIPGEAESLGQASPYRD